ncbi:Vacuolar ATPase assembly integral membrane protein VMA21-like domain-containing protein [Perilla frutescens var. frutescens]|nr:Vacuolar ATPase assembly integral membrane protein VMA21-like domain-containing protein [Perilla frutescens var. frutescens]
MFAAPMAILYGFNYNFLPGSSELSQEPMTLLSGILAVFSVNVVIAFYIYMAMKEPSGKPEPDPKFLAQAKASIKQSGPSQASDRSKHE